MKDLNCKITKNVKIANNIFSMTFHLPQKVDFIGGNFVNVQLDGEKLLRRPFGISDFDERENTMTIVYEVKGGGTRDMSVMKEGMDIKVLLPLGNGFSLLENERKVVLLGGGLGSVVFPCLVKKEKGREFYTFLGFATKDKVILESMRENSKEFYISTDDGSFGEKGFGVTKMLAELDRINPDIILACGPPQMFKALKGKTNVKTLVSLEERMGCGFGGCLVCTCQIERSGTVDHLRVCKEGPVFDLNEVVL